MPGVWIESGGMSEEDFSWRRGREREREHPENDLIADADRYNKPRPEAHSFDELADEPDPYLQAQANRRSTRQAWLWFAGTVILSLLAPFVLAMTSRLSGGEYCEAGLNTWLCSRRWELIWSLGSCVVPIGGMIGCGIIMVRKLQRYIRWGSWMGAFWFLVPHAMLWMTTVGQVAILGTHPA